MPAAGRPRRRRQATATWAAEMGQQSLNTSPRLKSLVCRTQERNRGLVQIFVGFGKANLHQPNRLAGPDLVADPVNRVASRAGRRPAFAVLFATNRKKLVVEQPEHVFIAFFSAQTLMPWPIEALFDRNKSQQSKTPKCFSRLGAGPDDRKAESMS